MPGTMTVEETFPTFPSITPDGRNPWASPFVAWDGSGWWVSYFREFSSPFSQFVEDTVRRFSADMTTQTASFVIASAPTSSNDIKGLAHNGTDLWMLQFKQYEAPGTPGSPETWAFRRRSTSTGAILQEVIPSYLSGAPTGVSLSDITFDATGQIWHVVNGALMRLNLSTGSYFQSATGVPASAGKGFTRYVPGFSTSIHFLIAGGAGIGADVVNESGHLVIEQASMAPPGDYVGSEEVDGFYYMIEDSNSFELPDLGDRLVKFGPILLPGYERDADCAGSARILDLLNSDFDMRVLKPDDNTAVKAYELNRVTAEPVPGPYVSPAMNTTVETALFDIPKDF